MECLKAVTQPIYVYGLRSETTYTAYYDRRLADGNVHCAGSTTYQICFRLPIPNPNPNPNPITDLNPNPNRKIIKKTTPE